MGQVRLTAKAGQNAARALETLVPGDIAGLQPGQQRYTQFTNESGGILDDLMVTSTGDHLLVVINAACRATTPPPFRSALRPTCRSGPLSSPGRFGFQGPLP